MKALSVFVDASIYRSANYQFSNEPLSLLFDLREHEDIHFLTHSVTTREIQKKINELCVELDAGFRKVVNEHYIIKASKKSLFSDMKNSKHAGILSQEILSSLDAFLKSLAPIEIPHSDVTLSEVLQKYFDGQPPFDKAEKKSEFPDAIVISDLNQFVQKGTKLHVVSGDNDFHRALRGDDRFIVHAELWPFLREAYGRRGAASRQSVSVIKRSSRLILNRLKAELRKQGCVLRNGDWEVVVSEVVIKKARMIDFTKYKQKGRLGSYSAEVELEFEGISSSQMKEWNGLQSVYGEYPIRTSFDFTFGVRFNSDMSKIEKIRYIDINNGLPLELVPVKK